MSTNFKSVAGADTCDNTENLLHIMDGADAAAIKNQRAKANLKIHLKYNMEVPPGLTC
jgi:hypothetical protein